MNYQAIEPSHISSGILLQLLHTVRNMAFMSNTSNVGCSRPKTLCLLSGLHFIIFIYFGSLVLSDCIALFGSIALLAKAHIWYDPVIK